MKKEMFLKMAALWTGVVKILGYSSVEDIPIDAENKKTNYSEEQKEKLKAAFGEKYESFIETMDNEIKTSLSNSLDLKAIEDEIAALVQENELIKKAQKEGGTDENDLKANLELLKQMQANQKETIEKLLAEGVGNIPFEVIKGGKKMKHSSTHLFGTNNVWDAFDKRNWNARLIDPSLAATDFHNETSIPLLQDDYNHFVRQNPKVLDSLFNDFIGLPKEWDRISGVTDRIANASIIAGEIVQAGAKGWSPNQKFKISVEEGKVFRKKIDIEFDGYELQRLETTWISAVANLEGSHPWKMSFIAFLLTEIIKQQMVDSRVAQINGIYSNNMGGDGNPGQNIDSQDGLMFQLWNYRDVLKKYRPFDIGKPTESSIVDYVDRLIKSIPEIERNQQGLELGLSQAWLDAYRVRAGAGYQVHLSTDQGKGNYTLDYPINYPNIKFQPLIDVTRTDFMYVTQSKNIAILDFNISEKGKFTISHGGKNPRNTTIFADYKEGIMTKFVGTKLADGEPINFEIQKIWSNNVPVFDVDKKMNVYDDKSGVIKIHYKDMLIDENWKTDIKMIDEAPKGMIVKITGNTGLAASKSVIKNANLLLVSNFDLLSGGTLTMVVQADGKLKELRRTETPNTIASTDKTFNSNIIDAQNGSVFKYVGTVDITVNNIINGVEGKSITIYGTDTAAVSVRISTVDNLIDVPATVILDGADNFLKLTLIDGLWTETNKNL